MTTLTQKQRGIVEYLKENGKLSLNNHFIFYTEEDYFLLAMKKLEYLGYAKKENAFEWKWTGKEYGGEQ